MNDNGKKYRIIISGGGTGGHIYPAIAIANKLKEKWVNPEILFVGALGKMEMQKVPEAGYPIKGIWISGIQRKLSLKNLLFPLKVVYSIIQSYFIIQKFKPDLAIGLGGFASGPLLWVASSKNIPTLIQEQNSYAGITNKWLSKKVDVICVAYDHMARFFPAGKIVITGNPVRSDILGLASKKVAACQYFKLDPGKKTMFIMGGSLGARTMNISVFNKIDSLIQHDIQAIWQIGKIYYDDYLTKMKDMDLSLIRPYEFINEMAFAYAAADLVISRAGALSISELCIAGKPVVFVPSPNVAEDHQTKNAFALAEKDAAIMVNDKDAPASLIDTAIELLANENQMQQLATNIKKMAMPDASERIFEEITKLLN